MARSTDTQLLELIGEVIGVLDLGELREALLVALDHAVPSEFVSINEIGPRPQDFFSVTRPEVAPHLHEVWTRVAHENPLIARFARTFDTRAYRFSDVISPEEFHALALYREFYAELEVEHQIAFVVSLSPPQYVGIALSRSRRDFTDAERDLLDRARPYLIGVYRAAITHTALRERTALDGGAVAVDRLVERGLTTREAAVLALVAHGRSNADVAVELGVSTRTVGKHLERSYRKLGAVNRSHAAALAWAPERP